MTFFHSAAIVLTELGADVVQADDFLSQLDVVTQIVWVAQVAEDVDDLLLLAQELLGELVTCLLARLLGSHLGDFLTLLARFFSRCLALAADSLALRLAGHSGWRRLSGGAIVLVHTLHVVEKIVAAGKAVTWHSALTVAEVAEVRASTVAVHAVSLTLMAKEASSRRELNAHTGLFVATEGLQVRVNVLAEVVLEEIFVYLYGTTYS
jgi:hypothetical protein